MSKGDSKGYIEGARGIDDNKGSDYTRKNVSEACIEAVYGRSWSSSAGASKKGLGDPWGGSK